MSVHRHYDYRERQRKPSFEMSKLQCGSSSDRFFLPANYRMNPRRKAVAAATAVQSAARSSASYDAFSPVPQRLFRCGAGPTDVHSRSPHRRAAIHQGRVGFGYVGAIGQMDGGGKVAGLLYSTSDAMLLAVKAARMSGVGRDYYTGAAQPAED